MLKIAVTHPGKQGDAIYALPAIRALCAKHGVESADFYTSSYCEPLRSLFQYQDCIANFYVAPNYVLERIDMGAQPFHVPVDASMYDAVYELGYRGTPDCPLPEFMARSVGISIGDVKYNVPDQIWFDRPYIVLAARGDTSYNQLFADVIEQCPITVMMIGAKGDDACVKQIQQGRFGKSGLDCTGWSYLDTASLISGAKAFVGLMSSQLCLANGFPIPKVVPHDGIHWDLRHIIASDHNFYPVNPSADQIMEMLHEVL